MNKRVSIGITIAFIFIAVAITFTATMLYAMNLFDQKIINVQERAAMYDKISEIDSVIRQNYYLPIEEKKVMNGLSGGYIAGLGDEYTRYMTSAEISQMQTANSGEIIGVGLEVIENASGYAVVQSVVTDSPADKIGMQVGDIIITVDGEDALVLGYDAVERSLIGAEGNQVTIGFMRNGSENSADLVYDTYAAGSVITGTVDEKYAYIRFTDFNELTVDQFKRAYDDAIQNESIRAFVFDVRGLRSGTDLALIASILDPLMPQGTIISGVYSGEVSKVLYTSDAEQLQYPAIVLVDENTKGLSELFAAVLGEKENVRIIGAQTAGKGTYQELVKLSDGTGIYVTVCKLIACGHLDFDKTGLTPDFIVLPNEGFEMTDTVPERNGDMQLRRGLEVMESELLS
ncbi:MAG: PDZ domain-containing protein [Oscillospiraceae bacterium]|nr:PDZ domain-containing protein [Oscillospiraceae bacterium]